MIAITSAVKTHKSANTRARLKTGGIPRTLILTLSALLVLSAVPASKGAGEKNAGGASALVTDRLSLPLSDQFTVPSQIALTNAGDVFFTPGPGAIFRWDSASASRVRMLQEGDPHPGLADSIAQGVGQSLRVNAVGHTAVVNSYVRTGGRNPSGVFVYDGTAFQTVALSGDIAPGPGGQAFSFFGQVRINDLDQVAFIGFLEPFGFLSPGLFIGAPSSPPVKIAVMGETAPGTGGGTYGDTFQLIGINNAGQVAFLSSINGGSTPLAVFIWAAGTVTKVVAVGDPAPGTTGTFNVPFNPANYFLNASGDLAFQGSSGGGVPSGPGIWVVNTSAPPTKLVMAGDATGTPLGGTFGGGVGGFAIHGFNNTGQVLFRSGLTGATTNHALFLKDLVNPAQVIFERNQPAPGGAVELFDVTRQATLNNSGDVAFFTGLQGGGATSGLFMGSGASPAVKIAFQGDATPAGGTFGLDGRGPGLQINSSGQVAFLADVLGPNQVGVFRWTSPSSIASVVTTGNTLPEGANPVLFTFSPAASDDVLVFQAFKAGGRRSVFTTPLRSPGKTVTRLFGEGDAAPGVGGTLWLFGFNWASINNSEEVPFLAGVVGGSAYPASGIFTHKPGAGLKKLVATGDAAPGADGGLFRNFNFGQAGRSSSKISSVGKVAFYAGVSGSSSPDGIFAGSASGGVQAVVRRNDPSPLGGTFSSFSNIVAMNEVGQVAFLANSSAGPQALFVGSAGSSPVKVVAQGDAVPGGTVANLSTSLQINNAGQLAYTVDLTGEGIADGVYIGTAGGTQFSVALAGQTAPGTGGGTFASFQEEAVGINNLSQVAFWAKLDAPSATTGFFLGSAGGAPAPRLLEGQSLPGGGIAGVLAPGVNFFPGELFALKDSGEMSMYVSDVALAPNLSRLVIANSTGVLRELASVGSKAKGTGSSYGRVFPPVSFNSAGRFFFFAALVDGSDKWGVFRDEPVK